MLHAVSKIVFSDIDGTLLDSKHRLLPSTLEAIQILKHNKTPFVIASARSPSGIYPILLQIDYPCPIICYSGALILDENRHVLYSREFDVKIAADIITFIENNHYDCSWNLYSMDTWIVRDKSDRRIVQEEHIVNAQAIEGDVSSLARGAAVHKIYCICNPTYLSMIEGAIQSKYPKLSVIPSSDHELEIVQKDVNKGSAVKWLCEHYAIPLTEAVAFGDHYNDLDMLNAVGKPVLMRNAPEELKQGFAYVTEDHNHDGIMNALKVLKVI